MIIIINKANLKKNRNMTVIHAQIAKPTIILKEINDNCKFCIQYIIYIVYIYN